MFKLNTLKIKKIKLYLVILSLSSLQILFFQNCNKRLGESSAPPSASATNLIGPAGAILNGQLLGSSGSGGSLEYSLLSESTLGSIVELNLSTGAFKFQTSPLANGSEIIQFQVRDTKTNQTSSNDLSIQINTFSHKDFEGDYQISSVLKNSSLACGSTSFKVTASHTSLLISPRNIVCGSVSTALKSESLTISPSGSLYRDTLLVGSINNSAITISESKYVSGCGNITTYFNLNLNSSTGSFSYSEGWNSACSTLLPSENYTGNANLISGSAVLSPLNAILKITKTPSTLAFGDRAQNSEQLFSFSINNSDNGPATLMSLNLAAGLKFKGGVPYPGQGGTCTDTLAAGATCTVNLAIDTSMIRTINAEAILSYFNGTTTVTISNLATASIYPLLINPTQYAVGFAHHCVLDSDTVKCWGDDTYGQSSVPLLSHPTFIATGDRNSCAIHDGGIKCWGQNTYDIITQMEALSFSNPTRIALNGSGGTSTAACAIDSNGVKCWGTVPSSSGLYTIPATLNQAREIAVSSGGHACALDADGVKCWGKNTYGQATVPTLSSPTALAVGFNHSCAIDSTGVVCWGDNSFGQASVHVAAKSPNVITALIAYAYTSCALVAGQGIRCWGDISSSSSKPAYNFGSLTKLLAMNTSGNLYLCSISSSNPSFKCSMP